MVRHEHARTLSDVCRSLGTGDAPGAAAILRARYPHVPTGVGKRRCSVHQMLATFVRDGFTDRYSGERLVFPGVFHVLSHALPDEFPAHPNWRMADTHVAYWGLMPTIDHVQPVALGGRNAPDNWVTTSMRRNSAKANWTLPELGWTLLPPSDVREWDGLMGWFCDYVRDHPDVLGIARVKRWHRACQARARVA